MKGMSKLVGHDTVRVDPTPISSLSCPKNWFSHLTSSCCGMSNNQWRYYKIGYWTAFGCDIPYPNSIH